jgi:hypothetical protein
LREEFEQWKLKHHKIYNAEEEVYRFMVYTTAKKEMKEHNKRAEEGLVSWYQGINQFSDMSWGEFSSIFLSPATQPGSTPAIKAFTCSPMSVPTKAAPTSLDWV